jgi:uncharacterized membrane protein
MMISAVAHLSFLFAQQAELGASSLTGLIVSLSMVVSGIGLVIIAWGTYSSLPRLIATETAAARGQLPQADALAGRSVFACYLIPALDFMAAGSLIKTFAVPDWQQAALLASLVFARTLIGLNLRWGITPAPGLTALPPVTEQLAAPAPPSQAPPVTPEGVASVGSDPASSNPLPGPLQRIVP